MPDEIEPTPLKSWKRERRAVVVEERPLRCGGPEYTAAERLELMRQRQREMEEAARRSREEQDDVEAREAAKRRAKSSDEEDEYLAAERLRKDRYAVKLLRQDDTAWGGTGPGSWTLG